MRARCFSSCPFIFDSSQSLIRFRSSFRLSPPSPYLSLSSSASLYHRASSSPGGLSLPTGPATLNLREPSRRPIGTHGPVRKLLQTSTRALHFDAFQAFRPPPPKICGTPGGPPVTAPRIKLRDGRHLAYKEHGLHKDVAKHKIVFVHGFTSCRLDPMIVTNLTPEVIEELGVYVVTFDRPGYGESDPDPNRTPKSLALDIEELADGLGLGSRFYLMGKSMGGQVVWGCLKYIPQRLAGAALIAPVINYWWPGFPAELCKEAYNLQLPQDQWALRVAHHAPWLTYWWNTQKLFPSSGVISRKRETMSRQDIELVSKYGGGHDLKKEATQQGEFESLHRDMMIGFGKWEFDPMDLENPFPNNEGSVYLWQGDDDKKVPVILQRYIAQKLPWIHYHELPGGGHVLHFVPGLIEGVLRALLRGGK